MFSAIRTLFRNPSRPVRRDRSLSAGQHRSFRPELEALSERLVPSGVPNLTGTTLDFGSGHSLRITSVSRPGTSISEFTGYFTDNAHFVSTSVSGYIGLLRSYADTSAFNVLYSGSTEVIPSYWYDQVNGNGTLTTVGNLGTPGAHYYYQGSDYDYCYINLWPLHISTSGTNYDYADSGVPIDY
jgi:hypothetical protein